MALQQSKNLLDKINSLYQNISLDGEISSIERDLMLSYVRQFYEAILAESNEKPVIPPAPKPVAVVVEAPPPPPKVVEVPIVPQPAPVVVVVPPPVPKPEPKIEMEIVAPKPEPIVVQTPPTQPIVIAKPAPKAPAQPKSLIKPTVERVERTQLFEEKMSKELSDKLGEMPIDDIKKGMSLNERIIFLNELFDGKNNEFENAVTNLNNAPNFEDAQQQLMILATRFDWSSKEKQAKTFIRLVKRKHSR